MKLGDLPFHDGNFVDFFGGFPPGPLDLFPSMRGVDFQNIWPQNLNALVYNKLANVIFINIFIFAFNEY